MQISNYNNFMTCRNWTRRQMLSSAAAPALLLAQGRPAVSHGVQSGDVTGDRATIWARADRPSRMSVEWATTEAFSGEVRRVAGPMATPSSGLTARVQLRGLPRDQTVFYRVRFDGGEAVAGRLRTAPAGRRDVRFVWSGDTCGQGYGINPDWGGMRIYETMRRTEPDFFLHSGDTIYADNPIPAEVKLPGGAVWRNVTTEAKSRRAQTLDDFRGAYLYNLMDANVRRFNAETPQIWQWDDHEVVNNWSPAMPEIHKLTAPGRQAFLEHAPCLFPKERIYRRIPYGPLLEVFVIDMRTYRGPNTWNRQTAEGPETAFLGRPQLEWLKRDLARSRAMWKVIAADMPLGLIVGDGKDAEGRPRYENAANGNGPALGRELEFAGLLGWMRRARIRNTVWLTADVHYTAAHYYDPGKAVFRDFDPFWEFVSGPLNAGTFGPAATDDTFGIQVMFQKAPPKGQQNLPPSAGMQFFGEVAISGKAGEMTVNLRDLAGEALYSKTLIPERP